MADVISIAIRTTTRNQCLILHYYKEANIYNMKENYNKITTFYEEK